MSDFSIPKAAFAGFGVLARKPGVVLIWFLFWLAFVVSTNLVGTLTAGDAFEALAEINRQARESGTPPNPTSSMQVAGQTSLYSLVSTILQIVMTVVFTAAVLRIVLRPGKAGLAYLRVGGDELRLAVVEVVVFVFTALTIGAGVLLTVVLGIVGVGISASTDIPRQAIALPLIALGVLATVCAVFFVMIKFSLARAQTMALRQVNLFGTWSLTKGRFFKLLATFLLMALAAAPIVLGMLAVAGLAAYSTGEVSGRSDAFTFLMYPPFSMEDFFTPARLAFYAAMSVSFTLAFTLFLAMPASVYKQIGGEEGVAGIFSDSGDDDDVDWDDDEEEWEER
jgi:hypothetical protein